MEDQSAQSQEVQTTKTVKGKLVWSIEAPTPVWATTIFRVALVLTGAAAFIIGSDDGIPPATKVRIMLYMTAFDRALWGLGRIIGVKKEDLEKQ